MTTTYTNRWHRMDALHALLLGDQPQSSKGRVSLSAHLLRDIGLGDGSSRSKPVSLPPMPMALRS